MEKAQKSGKIIIEKSSDSKERETVQTSLDAVNTELMQVKATLDERKLKVRLQQNFIIA